MEAKSIYDRFTDPKTAFAWQAQSPGEHSCVRCRDLVDPFATNVMFDEMLPQNDLADGDYGLLPHPGLFGDDIEVLVSDPPVNNSLGTESLTSSLERDDEIFTSVRPSAVFELNREFRQESPELTRPKKQKSSVDFEIRSGKSEYERLLTTMPKSRAGRKKKSVTANMSKNALAARENRERKRRYVEKLENAVRLLSAENEKLRQEKSAKEVTITSLQARMSQGLAAVNGRNAAPLQATGMTMTTQILDQTNALLY